MCVDTQSDPANCLGCGNACPAGQTCCGNAGCIDLASDLNNCGTCGTACAAGQSCSAGACQ